MRLFAAAVFAMTIGLAGLAQAGDQDFTLTNKTGYTVKHVYVSAASASSWEEDVLGEDTLDDGEHVDISFAKGTRGCSYDLKVVYDDGDSSEWGKLDLCSINKISIYWDRKAGTTRAVSE